MTLLKSIRTEKKKWLFILVSFVFFVGCNNGIKTDDPFLDLVGESVMLNGPLTISSDEKVIKLSGQFEDYFEENYFIIHIFNHSDENILFTDMDFNIRAFKMMKNSSEWEEVILPYFSPITKVILYPDSTSNIDGNFVPVLVPMIQSLDFEDYVRFYISGIGEETGNEYGAFIDVQLVRNDNSD